MPRGRPLIYGEVLFDCFPDGREVPGGAPFNVAWNLQAFGLEPQFISRIGNDNRGSRIREMMAAWKMDARFLQTDPEKPTGRVDITLDSGEPHFSILADQAYDYIAAEDIPDIAARPSFLYHGSLALRSKVSRTALNTLKQHHSCPVFLDINLRSPWWSRQDVLAMIEDACWLKLNSDECRTLFPDEPEITACGSMLLNRFGLDTVFMTMGSEGAMAFARGKAPLSVKPSVALQVVDTVGAGDAFSSVLLLGIMEDWPLRTAMERAQHFASAIVGQRGATLQDPEFYNSFLQQWIQS